MFVSDGRAGPGADEQAPARCSGGYTRPPRAREHEPRSPSAPPNAPRTRDHYPPATGRRPGRGSARPLRKARAWAPKRAARNGPGERSVEQDPAGNAAVRGRADRCPVAAIRGDGDAPGSRPAAGTRWAHAPRRSRPRPTARPRCRIHAKRRCRRLGLRRVGIVLDVERRRSQPPARRHVARVEIRRQIRLPDPVRARIHRPPVRQDEHVVHSTRTPGTIVRHRPARPPAHWSGHPRRPCRRPGRKRHDRPRQAPRAAAVPREPHPCSPAPGRAGGPSAGASGS